MGFSTGFIGGLTLTYSLLYLSLHLHHSNRSVQHNLLSQQSALLNSMVLPPPPPGPEPPRWETKRESVTEMLKDRWNGEVEGLVKKVQHIDWNEVREGIEGTAQGAWRKLKGDD